MMDKILDRYKDELRDVAAYTTMATGADTDTLRSILRDIAREERQHAAMLRHVLEKHDAYKPTDEVRRLEEEANRAMEH